MHIKFNIEVMKAFNVAVAQKLGWIRKQEDIKKEFANEEMKEGADEENCTDNRKELTEYKESFILKITKKIKCFFRKNNKGN